MPSARMDLFGHPDLRQPDPAPKPMQPCAACLAAQGRQHGGGRYNLVCLDCCVRLVQSTRPNRAAAAAMLAVITRRKGSPSRAAVLGGLREDT